MLVEVVDASQVAAARRAAADLARDQGADEVITGRVAIVASELATNLLKHGGGGSVVTDLYNDRSGAGVEMLAFDKGTGIADLDQAMADGFSTAGTSGGGLGAIQRQADQFAVYSKPTGTVIMARVGVTPPAAGAADTPVLGLVHAPYPGERVSGDGWAYALSSQGPTLLAVDGSGHGAAAEAAAAAAIAVFREHFDQSCVELMERMHLALGSTRGGAVAIARMDHKAGVIRYVGVGNITGVVLSSAGTKRMVSHNGTVGQVAPRIREFTYPYNRPATVILHSDGLSQKWDMASYPGLAVSHPSLIAGVLFRDYWRGRDDGLVVALRTD